MDSGNLHIGLKKSLVFYLIITFITFSSLYFFAPIGPLFSYSTIILLAYIFKMNEERFYWGRSWRGGFLFGLFLISSIFVFEFGSGWIKFEGLNPDAIYILSGAVFFELLVSVGEELSFRGYIYLT